MDADAIFQPRFSLESPYLADYFGLWMVHDTSLLRAVERTQGMDLRVHLQSDVVRQQVRDRDRSLYPVTKDGIAQISIRGPMMKAVPSMTEGTSTVRVRQQLKAARRDEEVRGVMLVMDTPGGTAKGNEDLANEVAATAKEKPVYAFIEDMTASAGVSVASMATRRYANNATALYGSMGTYAVLYDESGMAEKLGVRVHVIRAGEFKGMGEPGTQITDGQLEEIQRVVNRVNEAYLQTIARGLGRSIESILPLADGRVIMAADAVAAGLINGIRSYEETYAELAGMVPRRATTTATSRRSQPMADTPASLADLKATFPNSTAEWRESQLEAGVTLAEASINYAKYMESQFAAEREKHARELEEAKNVARQTAASPSLGHVPLTAATAAGDEVETGDAVEDFNAAVRARLPQHRMATLEDRQAAIAYVARKQPHLHRAYIVATNSRDKKTQRLIDEKFEVQGASR